MKRSWLLAMTALGSMVLAGPADAAWVRLGQAHVEHNRDSDMTYSRFAGPVENLTLMARGSDMYCRGVVARYGNGRTQRVFSGKLYEGQGRSADIAGRHRRIQSVTMNCSAANPRGGELVVGANVGRFRAAWEQSRRWAGHVYNDMQQAVASERDQGRYRYADRYADHDRYAARDRYGDHDRYTDNDRGRLYERDRSDNARAGDDDDRGWTTIGRENFEGRHDFESAYAGWRGRNVDRIALRPVDSDARCTRVSATFGNGRTRDLDIDRGDVLERGRLKVIDLPGDERDVRKVDLNCRAVGDRDVTIEVLTKS